MPRKILRAHNISRGCLLCGKDNPFGLHARFWELEGEEILCVITPRDEHQSYPGRMHGGIAAAILDETIGRAANIFEPEGFGVTAELTTKYRKPVPLDVELRAVARITKNNSRMFEGTGELLLPDGTVAVEAWGRYVKLPVDKIAEGDFTEDWIVDEREVPETIDL